MTRFARVQGPGKPSFNKGAEEATPWEVLKQPVEECLDDEEGSQEEKQLNQKENISLPVNTVWCEFEKPQMEKKNQKCKTEKFHEEKGKKRHKKAHRNEPCGIGVDLQEETSYAKLQGIDIDCLKQKRKKKKSKVESDISESTCQNEFYVDGTNLQKEKHNSTLKDIEHDNLKQKRKKRKSSKIESDINEYTNSEEMVTEDNVNEQPAEIRKERISNKHHDDGVDLQKDAIIDDVKQKRKKRKSSKIESDINKYTNSEEMVTEDNVNEQPEEIRKERIRNKHHDDGVDLQKDAIIDDVKQKRKKKNNSKIGSDISECTNKEENVKEEKLNEHPNGTMESENAEGECKPFKRRKPNEDGKTVFMDGQEIKLVRFDGFYVKEDDANRLKELKIKLLKNNVPMERIKFIIKKERQKAERTWSRRNKKLCFNCRRFGHNLTTCPTLSANGICYKCGSTEHSMFQCKAPWDELKFATCFVCKEKGHLSKNCPDNPRGLYPNGGGCRLCGDVTHLRQDCPKILQKNNKMDKVVVVDTFKKGKFSVDEDYEENTGHKTVNSKNAYSAPKPKKIIFK